MKYNTIKNLLRRNIKDGLTVLWTWDRSGKNFTMIYKNYSDDLPIYTPSQLLDKIDEEITPVEGEIVS